MPDENLPAPVEVNITNLVVPNDEVIKDDATDSTIINSDVAHANNMLKALYGGWSAVRSINALLAMVNTTMDVVERRRKLLNRQHGYDNPNQGSSNATRVWPVR